MRPMLATYTGTVPAGTEWVHEVKWDGMRVIAQVSADPDTGVRLLARSGRDKTVTFPELQGLALPDLVLDGEIVALEEGVPSFGALAERMGVTDAVKAGRLATRRPVTVMLFDVLSLESHSLIAQPWHRRRAVLDALAGSLDHARWVVPPVYDDGLTLLDATQASGLEGVVSKRRNSPYLPGRRSEDWLKRPHRRRRSVVVGGWRPETGGRGRLGAILVGEPGPDGTLRFRGRVGSGLAGRTGDRLRKRLQPLTTTESPFDAVPTVDADGTTWVRPDLVVEVESLGHADESRLRQPVFHGVREDLSPADLGVADIGDDLSDDGQV